MLSVDRQRGTLLGLAVADALGPAVEFQLLGTFPEVTGYRGGGPHGLAPGEWTDDSSMALALADSIASSAGTSTTRPAATSPGGGRANTRSTAAASTSASRPEAPCGRFEKTGDARTSGDPSEQASGNGSIMRLAPVPIRYADLFPDELEKLVRCCMESSLPTHASPQCLSACATWVWCWRPDPGVDRQEVLGRRLGAPASAEGNPCPSSRSRRGRLRQLPPQEAARDRWQRLRRQKPGGCAVGLPRRQGLPGGRAAGREPGR